MFFAGNLTPGMELLPNHMEPQSLLMELQNLPMEHLCHHMDHQSLHMRLLFPLTKPQNPHTEHQSLLMEHQNLLIAAQLCQHQCMLLHLPSMWAHPMERPQLQWCKLPMSGGGQQDNLDQSIGMERIKYFLVGPCSKNFPDSEFVGIRERQTSRPPLTLTLEWMFPAQQGKEGLMNATVCLLPRCLYILVFLCPSLSPFHPIFLFQPLSDILTVSF